MAKKPEEPPSKLTVKYIESPLQKYYGIQDMILWPHILVAIIILGIIGIAILI